MSHSLDGIRKSDRETAFKLSLVKPKKNMRRLSKGKIVVLQRRILRVSADAQKHVKFSLKLVAQSLNFT